MALRKALTLRLSERPWRPLKNAPRKNLEVLKSANRRKYLPTYRYADFSDIIVLERQRGKGNPKINQKTAAPILDIRVHIWLRLRSHGPRGGQPGPSKGLVIAL